MIRTILSPWILFAFLTSASEALEFRIISWSGEIRDVKYVEDSKEISIVAYDNDLSSVFTKSNAKTPLVLFKDATTSDGKRTRQILATIPLPEASIKSAILLLSRPPTSSAQGESMAGRWLIGEEKPGSTSIYNFCASPLAIKSGAAEWLQQPGEKHVLEVASDSFSLGMRIGKQVKGKWQVVSNFSTPMRPQLHALVLIKDTKGQLDGSDTPIEIISVYTEPPPTPTASKSVSN